VNLVEGHLLDPLTSWTKGRVFVNSMSDLFHGEIPDAWIDRVMAVAALASHKTLIVLTKREERMLDYMNGPRRYWDIRHAMERVLEEYPRRRGAGPWGEAGVELERYLEWPIPNLWLGVSAHNEDAVRTRVKTLLRVPAEVRVLSLEPCVGPAAEPIMQELDWVLLGGESESGGHRARPMSLKWARDIRDTCAGRVPFFFKQWGNWLPGEHPEHWPEDRIALQDATYIDHAAFMDLRENALVFPDGTLAIHRQHKSENGRMLDGRFWDESPVDRWA